MHRRPSMIVLALATGTLVAAGCARPEGSPGMQKPNLRANPSPPANGLAPEDPPKILPRTHFAAGTMFETQGLTAKAIEQYRKAIAVNHEYAEAYHRLGRVLSTTGQHAEAVEAMQKAVALKPQRPVFQNDLGFELMYLQRWTDAEHHFRQAIALQPKMARAHINLGLVLSRMGRFDEALASFRVVLPEADAYYNLGLMYRAHGRLEQALEAFGHALAVDERFTAARKQMDQISAKAAQRQAAAAPQSSSNTVSSGRSAEAIGVAVVAPIPLDSNEIESTYDSDIPQRLAGERPGLNEMAGDGVGAFGQSPLEDVPASAQFGPRAMKSAADEQVVNGSASAQPAESKAEESYEWYGGEVTPNALAEILENEARCFVEQEVQRAVPEGAEMPENAAFATPKIEQHSVLVPKGGRGTSAPVHSEAQRTGTSESSKTTSRTDAMIPPSLGGDKNAMSANQLRCQREDAVVTIGGRVLMCWSDLDHGASLGRLRIPKHIDEISSQIAPLGPVSRPLGNTSKWQGDDDSWRKSSLGASHRILATPPPGPPKSTLNPRKN